MKRDEEEKLQKRFRWKFFERSNAYQDFKSGKIGPERMLRSFPNFRIFKPLTLSIEELKDGKDEFLNELKKVVAGVPSIDIVYSRRRTGLKSVSLNYLARNEQYLESIDKWRKQSPDRFRKHGRFLSLLNAINKRDNTILIKIHLDKKKGNIIKDIKHLLSFVEKEAKYRKFDLRRPKPHWDEYEKYLTVWDLRVKNKMKWIDIAKRIRPLYFEGKKPEPETAINLAKHYYRQAKIKINGKWKQL